MLDVVGVAGQGESRAAGEGAVLVAEDQRGPDAGGDQPAGAADVEDLTLSAEDRGDDLRIAGEPADRSSRQRLARGEESLGVEPVAQIIERHGQRQAGGGGVGVGQVVGGLEAAAGLD